MINATMHHLQLGSRRIDYRIVHSKTARKMRIRVGPNGVDVIRPATRPPEDVFAFLDSNTHWLLDQLGRVERLRRVRRDEKLRLGEIFFRGEPTPIRIETTRRRGQGSSIKFADGEIIVKRGRHSHTPVARSLENWLRKQARADIEKHLAAVTAHLRRQPHRIYVMEQRTKWGNCSAEGNLSFNWRLVLAPDFVLRYLITHEAVHLAVPDHSAKFWLTVQSLCRDTERAKQWLCANGWKLTIDLKQVLKR